jgi:hypothetical protein
VFDATGSALGDPFDIGLNEDTECGERVAGVADDAGDVMLVWTWRNAESTGSADLQAMILPGLLAAQ